MKRLLLFVLFWTSLATAQVVGPGFVDYVTSAPSGACSQGAHQQNILGSGLVYTCQSGTWTQIGAGAGSVTNIATTSPITGGPITTTGTIACATCATTTNGGLLSGTTPIAISAGGVISISSPLPVANGGTNAATAPNALISLFPTASEVGDLVYCATFAAAACTSWAILPGNTSGTKLLQETNAGVPSWVAGGSGTVTATGGSLTSNAVVLGAGTTDTKVSTGITTNGVAELDVGVVGTNGVIGWKGSTSGTATCTAPAVAGTATNPIACTNALTVGAGAEATPGLNFVGDTTSGLSIGTGGLNHYIEISQNAAMTSMIVSGSGLYQMRSNGGLAWTGTTHPYDTVDTSITRSGIGIVAIGTTTSAGDTTGRLKASAYMSVGTKFTLSTNGCSATTTLGGGSAGSFLSGTTGTCTVTILMGDSATAPTGWHCTFEDHTTPANFLSQTGAADTTHCSMTGTTVSGDLITFSARGY